MAGTEGLLRVETHRETHQTRVHVDPIFPRVVDAGTDMTVKISVSCPSGCDLRGTPVIVAAADAVVAVGHLITFENNTNETAPIRVTAPTEVGDHVWDVVFLPHESKSLIHVESRLPIAFRSTPHSTSMAVWAVPAPLVVNRPFKVKVGIKCSASCQLVGHVVEMSDEAGTTVSRGTIGDSVWPGSEALYWGEIEVPAPTTESVAAWTVRSAATDLPLPHEAAAATFSSRVMAEPARRVTINVIAQETGLPVDDMEVRLGMYEAYADRCGVAVFEVPKGSYCLTIRKDGYKAEPQTVDVDLDASIRIEALKAPTKEEIEERMMRFEDYHWG